MWKLGVSWHSNKNVKGYELSFDILLDRNGSRYDFVFVVGFLRISVQKRECRCNWLVGKNACFQSWSCETFFIFVSFTTISFCTDWYFLSLYSEFLSRKLLNIHILNLFMNLRMNLPVRAPLILVSKMVSNLVFEKIDYNLNPWSGVPAGDLKKPQLQRLIFEDCCHFHPEARLEEQERQLKRRQALNLNGK